MQKDIVPKGIIYQKALLRIITSSSVERTFNSDIKQFGKIRKLTTGQGEDYNTVCLLD